MNSRLSLIAVLIPLLGLAALIGRAEYVVRASPTWRIPIEGYDPRDLLHGQYLQYRFRFRWEGEHTCAQPTPPQTDPRKGVWTDPDDTAFLANRSDCCLCLSRRDATGVDPAVTVRGCDEAETTCEAFLRSDAIRPPLRYFIPEDRAPELEDALRWRVAALELVASPNGELSIVELYLDGKPWRETLGAEHP